MSVPPEKTTPPRARRARARPSAPQAPPPRREGAPGETTRARDIGLDVRLPKESCSDGKCPFHGHVKVRGQVLEGLVVSAKMQGTVVVSRTVLNYVSKYERYAKRRHRYLAHAPPCLRITEGRRVRIAETRSLAKNVSFVVVADLGRGDLGTQGEEAVPIRPSKLPDPPPPAPEGSP
jgi:small subunit ribosomal protein S17